MITRRLLPNRSLAYGQPYSYDVVRFERWLEALDRRGLLTEAHILAGIGPLRLVKTARFLNERIPGVSGLHIMSVGWESILPRLLQQVRLSEGGSLDECAVDLS